MMDTTILAQISELHAASAVELKARWRELFASEPPPYNRCFLESRLVYRIQELALGGLTPDTRERLAALGEAIDGNVVAKRKPPAGNMPLPGTRLVREWQGVEHTVTVLADGLEWQGRPYKSLSAVARAISGTPWNGWTFFGLKNERGQS